MMHKVFMPFAGYHQKYFKFPQDFPTQKCLNWKKITAPLKTIVNAANSIIKQNKDQMRKKFLPIMMSGAHSLVLKQLQIMKKEE